MPFVVRRLAFYVVAVWAAVTVNFAIPRLMPGNAVDAMLGILAAIIATSMGGSMLQMRNTGFAL